MILSSAVKNIISESEKKLNKYFSQHKSVPSEVP